MNMMWSTTLSHQADALIQWAAVISGSLVAAAIDVRSRRIPNWLTGPLLLGGLVAATIWAGTWGLLESLGAGALLALPFVLLFIFAGGGAGDAKLMAAIGCWVGLGAGLGVLLNVALWGVALGVAMAVRHGQLKAVFANIRQILRLLYLVCYRVIRPTEVSLFTPQPVASLSMPYGLAIFLGVCTAAMGTWLWS